MPAPRPQPVIVNGRSRVADALRQLVEQSPLLALSESSDTKLVAEVQDGRFVFVLEGRALGAARFTGMRPERSAFVALQHLAGYLNIRNLKNPYTKLKPPEVELKRLNRLGTKDKPGEADPLFVEDGQAVIASGRSLTFEVFNLTEVPLHVYILDLDQDMRLAPLYPPSGFGKPIRPGEALKLGFGPEEILMSVPRNQTEGTDHFVILTSVGTADISNLSLPALGEKYTPTGDLFGSGSRLDRDLRSALTGQVPDAATALDPKDDWTVVHRTVVVRKA